LIIHSVNMAARFPELSEEEIDNILALKTSIKIKMRLMSRMIKQLLNSVIAKYRDLSVPRSQSFASAADGIGK